MNLAMNKKVLSSTSLKIAFFFIFLLLTANLGFYFNAILNTWQFVEPAENENLVLTEHFKIVGAVTTVENMISNGIYPIYPTFYHQLSACIPLESHISGRLISIISMLVVFIVFAIFVYKKTGNIYYCILLPFLLYGKVGHQIFFLMQRVDGLMIALGFLSYIIFWWNIDLSKSIYENILNVSIKSRIISGFFLGLVLLTKQTALVFFMIYFIPALLYLNSKKIIYVIGKYLIVFFTCTLVILLNYLFLDKIFFKSYFIGLRMFGSDISFPSILVHLVELLKHYSLYIASVFILLLSKTNRLKKDFFILILMKIFIIGFISTKLFSNSAAFHNNFILISSFSLIFIVILFKIASTVRQKITTCLLLLALLTNNLYIDNEHLSIKSSQKKYIDRAKEFKEDDSGIFQFLKFNSGKYLTHRLDNYLIQSNNPVIYESSVLSNVFYAIKYHNNFDGFLFGKSLDSYYKELEKNIKSKKFDGILLGIGGSIMLEIFPEIKNNYYLYISEKIYNGPHSYNAELWLPKEVNYGD